MFHIPASSSSNSSIASLPPPAPSTRWSRLRSHFRGLRKIILSSWLNVLLLFMPVSGILVASHSDASSLISSFCILTLVPLIRLHDLGTAALSMRIGGSRTGLLNASMSNMVELVLAVTALRKCELRLVQSSLNGAILCKLLLVLGICFFAGGTRFSEQMFDPSAAQIHSSLLSIGMNAMLIPAVFHFTYPSIRAIAHTNSSHESRDLDPADTGVIEEQRRDILKMSRGVAVVLVFIYCAYLFFQLWSHVHLYEDPEKRCPSRRLSLSMPPKEKRMDEDEEEAEGRPSMAPTMVDGIVVIGSPEQVQMESGLMCSTLASSTSIELDGPTLRLVNTNVSHLGLNAMGHPVPDEEKTAVNSPVDPVELNTLLNKTGEEHELSWTMTLLLLVTVTVVRIP
jgi:calcium/proton exchanger cax